MHLLLESKKLKETENLVLKVSDNEKFENPIYHNFKSLENGKLTFENVEINQLNYFTLEIKPQLFVSDKIFYDCENTIVALNIISKKFPVVINVLLDNKILEQKNSNIELINFNNLQNGNYSFEITDQLNNKIVKTISVKNLNLITNTIKPEWFINMFPTKIFTDNATNNVTYKWFSENEVVSTQKELIANKAGNYMVLMENDKGCKKELKFNVLPNGKEFNVYPNPIHSNQELTIFFNKKSTNVKISFFDFSGKLIYEIDEKEIEGEYKINLPIKTLGLYNLIVKSNQINQTTKLILE